MDKKGACVRNKRFQRPDGKAPPSSPSRKAIDEKPEPGKWNTINSPLYTQFIHSFVIKSTSMNKPELNTPMNKY
jgi:hypothetical protein